jgi:threonine/homoserine efflux transporter RhtA
VALTIEHKEVTTVSVARLPVNIAIAIHTLKTMIVANHSSKSNQTKKDKGFGFTKVA